MADVADEVDIMPDLVDHVSRVFMCIVCFLGIVLPLPTFRAYYNRRAPTTFPGCNMIALNCLLCLQYLINAVIWPTQDINNWWDGTGLCDIQAPLKYPFTLSLALSLWRLMNALATAVRGQPQFELSNAERRNLLLKEALYCWLVPLVQIPLSYLVRRGRFAVVPVMGCADLLDDSWVKFLIITVWCPLVMLLTSYSAVCIIVRVLKHRRNISGILVYNESGLRDRMFLRMAIISIVVLLSYIPVQGAFFFNAISSGVTSYSLFDNYSNGWNQPDRLTLADYGGQMSQYIGWTSAAWNLVFFLFSGFERESVIETRKMLVELGFGKFWPCLVQPLQTRCGTASSNRTLLQNNRLTSWMFDPVTLRFDPFGNLLTWLATSPRLDKWAAGKFMQWVEGAMASTSEWFRRCLQWNWSSRRSISNNQATTVVGEDLEFAEKNASQTTLYAATLDDFPFYASTSTLFSGRFLYPASSAGSTSSITSSPLRNEVRPGDILEQASTQPTNTAFRRVSPTGLFSTFFRTQLNLPTNLFSRRSTANRTVAPLPNEFSIPREQSFHSFKSLSSAWFYPYPDLVATRVWTGNAFETVCANSASSNSGTLFAGSSSSPGYSAHASSVTAEPAIPLGIPSSSTSDAASDFASATRAAPFDTRHPSIELEDFVGSEPHAFGPEHSGDDGDADDFTASGSGWKGKGKASDA